MKLKDKARAIGRQLCRGGFKIFIIIKKAWRVENYVEWAETQSFCSVPS